MIQKCRLRRFQEVKKIIALAIVRGAIVGVMYAEGFRMIKHLE